MQKRIQAFVLVTMLCLSMTFPAHAGLKEFVQNSQDLVGVLFLKAAHPISTYKGSKIIGISPSGVVTMRLYYDGALISDQHVDAIVDFGSEMSADSFQFKNDTSIVKAGAVSKFALTAAAVGISHLIDKYNTTSASEYAVVQKAVEEQELLNGIWDLKLSNGNRYKLYVTQYGIHCRNGCAMNGYFYNPKYDKTYYFSQDGNESAIVERNPGQRWTFAIQVPEVNTIWRGEIRRRNGEYYISKGEVRDRPTWNKYADISGTIHLP